MATSKQNMAQKQKYENRRKAAQALRDFPQYLQAESHKYIIQVIENDSVAKQNAGASEYSGVIYIGKKLDSNEGGYPCKIFMEGTPQELFYVSSGDYEKIKKFIPKEIDTESFAKTAAFKAEFEKIKAEQPNLEDSAGIEECIKKLEKFIEALSETGSEIKAELSIELKEAKELKLKMYHMATWNMRIASFRAKLAKATDKRDIVALKLSQLETITAAEIEDYFFEAELSQKVRELVDEATNLLEINSLMNNLEKELDQANGNMESVSSASSKTKAKKVNTSFIREVEAGISAIEEKLSQCHDEKVKEAFFEIKARAKKFLDPMKTPIDAADRIIEKALLGEKTQYRIVPLDKDFDIYIPSGNAICVEDKMNEDGLYRCKMYSVEGKKKTVFHFDMSQETYTKVKKICEIEELIAEYTRKIKSLDKVDIRAVSQLLEDITLRMLNIEDKLVRDRLEGIPLIIPSFLL